MNSYALKIMVENGNFIDENGCIAIISKNDIMFYVLLEENQNMQGEELEKRIDEIWQEYKDFVGKNSPVFKNWCEKYFPTLEKTKAQKMQELIVNGHDKSIVTFAQEIVELMQKQN